MDQVHERLNRVRQRIDRLGYRLHQSGEAFEIREPWERGARATRIGSPVEGMDELEHMVDGLETEGTRR